MKRIYEIVFALSFLAAVPAAFPQDPFGAPNPERSDPLDRKMPNGKSQRDEIAKADHEKNLEDAARLEQLSTEVHDELEKSGSGVVSLKMLKKLDDMEKLTRNIRGRLKRL
jgi:hypothetical protein